MRSLGFKNKESMKETAHFAIEKEFSVKISFREQDQVYFIFIDDLPFEKADQIIEFARRLDGLLWYPDLRKRQEDINRAYDEFYD